LCVYTLNGRKAVLTCKVVTSLYIFELNVADAIGCLPVFLDGCCYASSRNSSPTIAAVGDDVCVLASLEVVTSSLRVWFAGVAIHVRDVQLSRAKGRSDWDSATGRIHRRLLWTVAHGRSAMYGVIL